MINLPTPYEVEQQFHHLVQDGAYEKALNLVTQYGAVFPEHAQKVVYYWRMSMACHLVKKDIALSLLEEALQAGYWFAGLDTDLDFQLLYGDPEFERLAELGRLKRAQAIATAIPVMKIHKPDARPPFPLLIALHGSNSNIEAQGRHWFTAVDQGWMVVMPQSSQAYAPGTYTWNDWEWAQQEICERFSTICNENPIDPTRIVLSGFSQGGGLALWLVLSGKIKVQGLLLVGPFLDEVSQIVPLLKKDPPNGLRVYIGAGLKDRYCHGIAKQLAALFPDYGIACKLEEYPDLEHSFPQDFENKLPDALRFLFPDRSFQE